MKKELRYVTTDGKTFDISEGKEAEDHEFKLKLTELFRQNQSIQLTPTTISHIILTNKAAFQKEFSLHTQKTSKYKNNGQQKYPTA